MIHIGSWTVGVAGITVAVTLLLVYIFGWREGYCRKCARRGEKGGGGNG
jgi:hypothetical protein